MLNRAVSRNTDASSPSKPNMNSPNTMMPYECTFSTSAAKVSGRFTCLWTLVRVEREIDSNPMLSNVQPLAAASSSIRSSCASLEVTPACHVTPRPFSARMTSFGRSGVPKKSASLIEIVLEPQLSISRTTSATGR